ncbi:MAG: putative Ig domain-containing protein [Fibromonadales bacterium]|nr:putative Ig domain-containing protein [Fibromonadales bacterium]
MVKNLFPKFVTLVLATFILTATVTAQTTTPHWKERQKAKAAEFMEQQQKQKAKAAEFMEQRKLKKADKAEPRAERKAKRPENKQKNARTEKKKPLKPQSFSAGIQAFSGIQSAPPTSYTYEEEITGSDFPFSRTLNFDGNSQERVSPSPWNDGYNEYIKVFKLDLSEGALIRYASGHNNEYGWDSPLYIYTDEELTKQVGNDYWEGEGSILVAAGIYYLVFTDDTYYSREDTYYNAIVKLEKIEDLTVTEINVPLQKKECVFNDQTAIVWDARVCLYQFTLNEPTILSLKAESDNDVLFSLNGYSEYNNLTNLLPAGIHWIAVVEARDGNYNVNFSVEESKPTKINVPLTKAELNFSDETTINLWESRVFVYQFKLDEPTTLSFNGDDNFWFELYGKQFNYIDYGYHYYSWYGWDDYNLMMHLPTDTYYLIVYEDKGGDDYTLNFSIDEKFTKIGFPLPKTECVFNDQTATVDGQRACLYQFKLEEPTILSFNSNDDFWFEVYEDPFLQDEKDYGYSNSMIYLPPAETYYLVIWDWSGDDIYKVNFTINTFQGEDYAIKEIDGLDQPFSEVLVFHPKYNSIERSNCDEWWCNYEVLKVFKLKLEEDTQIRYIHQNWYSTPLYVYADEKLTEELGFYRSWETFNLPQGEYYLAFSNDYGGYYSTSVKLEKFNGYDFTNITKFPFTAKLDFDSETEFLWDARVFMYQFELTETTVLTFGSNSNRPCFDILSDPMSLSWVGNGYNGSSTILPPGKYYLVIGDWYWENYESYDFTANIKITVKALQEPEVITLNQANPTFSSALYFHQDFNSSINGNGSIEKVFRLELDVEDDVQIMYYGCGQQTCSWLSIYRNADLEDKVYEMHPWSDIYTLSAGTYYLVFTDNYYAYDNDYEDYASTFVNLGITTALTFQPIEIPHLTERLDFTPSTAVRSLHEYLKAFTFELEEDATVYFHGDFSNWGPNVYIKQDSEFDSSLEGVNGDIWIDCSWGGYDDEGRDIIDYCYTSSPLVANTPYYIAFGDADYSTYNDGHYYSTYIYISTSDEKSDVEIPPFTEIVYTVTFNSNGSSNVPSQTIDNWKFATQPAALAKTGFVLSGWYNGNDLWNFANDFVTENVTLTAKWTAATISINATTIADGTIGQAYSASVQASVEQNAGGTISYAIISGNLPSGLTLNSSTGEITGTPDASGLANFTVKATHANGNTTEKAFSISISAESSIRLPQIATGNKATQTLNGINLHVANNAAVEIYNLNGSMVSKQTFANGVYTIQLGHLPKGMYIAKVSFGSEKQTLRIAIR